MNQVYDHSFLVYLAALAPLYAETHYAFKGIYSRLKKPEPEILADVPIRIEPGHCIPVLLIVKDADQYPVTLHEAHIQTTSGAWSQDFRFPLEVELFRKRFWFRILELRLPDFVTGACKLDVVIQATVAGQRHLIRNDNYALSSHAPFDVFIGEDALPGFDGWHFGEFHCHTSFTDDQVEFGAPLEATVALARSMGLSFLCATDHSYDLDDLPGNYLESDPQLAKWKQFRNEVVSLNANSSDFIIIPGEEVSAGNSRNRNVHLLVLNHPTFLPGDGDGAEKWFRTAPTLTISKILSELDEGAVAFAAHPGARPPWLQWLLVRRGEWRPKDCAHSRLSGLQVWNGSNDGLEAGMAKWKALLLRGLRPSISGGNDAHGNFNRFRQIGFPFWTMRENHHHLFGQVRTAAYLKEPLNVENLVKAFKRGSMVVTDGPFLDIAIRNQRGRKALIGEEIAGSRLTLNVRCRSTPEFGALQRLSIYFGSSHRRREMLLKQLSTFSMPYEHVEKIQLDESSGAGYVRGELFSGDGATQHRCFTNPIWVNTGTSR